MGFLTTGAPANPFGPAPGTVLPPSQMPPKVVIQPNKSTATTGKGKPSPTSGLMGNYGIPINTNYYNPSINPFHPQLSDQPIPAAQGTVNPLTGGSDGGYGPQVPTRLTIPSQVSGSYPFGRNTYSPQMVDQPPAPPSVHITNSNGTNQTGLTATPSLTMSQYAAQVKALIKKFGLNGLVSVPGALSLSNIANKVNSIPSMNMPGAFTNAAIAQAEKGGPGTPGYINPAQAAAAAAQQQYGGAVSGDQLAVNNQIAQGKQDSSDIQDWYARIAALMQQGRTDDTAGFNAAVQGTGVEGSAMAAALGMTGSPAASGLMDTGSIDNAAARMAQASGIQQDTGNITNAQLSGVQSLANTNAQNQTLLSGLQNTLASDTKNKGAAYTTALDAARQTDNTNAQAHAQLLGQLNQNYTNQYQNKVTNDYKGISALAGLNSQYTTQGLNAIKTKEGLITTAAGLQAAPSTEANNQTKTSVAVSDANARLTTAQASWLRANTAKYTAQNKVSGVSLTGKSPASATARNTFTQNIISSIGSAPGIVVKNAAGAATSIDVKAASNIITAMFANAGLPMNSPQGQAVLQQIDAYMSKLAPTAK